MQWYWIPLAALAILVLYQQFRIYQTHRNALNREELFQIVTENAADMIALVDVKGKRLYNSPAYKRILGYSPAELGETSSFEQVGRVSRNRDLARYQDSLHPALLRLVAAAVQAARRAGIDLSVCGEMAGDPVAALALVGLGVRQLSMASSSLAAVRRAIRAASATDLAAEAERALDAASASDVRERFRRLRELDAGDALSGEER